MKTHIFFPKIGAAKKAAKQKRAILSDGPPNLFYAFSEKRFSKTQNGGLPNQTVNR